MAVLVTGATGFIGRRLVARLTGSGEDVRALALPGEDAGALACARVVRGDVRDPESVRSAARGVRRVYHLAARVGDWGSEAGFQAVNVDGTRNVLDAAARAGCDRVVVVSSIAVYGSQLRTAICDEDRPRERGVGPYSRTKAASEALALSYHELGRVPVTVVRPGNVFGPGARLWVDLLVDVLRAGAGMVVDGGRGDAALAYVDNVVDVLARAAAASGAAGRIYNATDGGGVTWRAYAEDLARLAGARGPRASMPHAAAYAIAAGMETFYRALRSERRPLLTRDAVTLMSSRAPVPVERAAAELGHRREVGYGEALERTGAYLASRT